MTEIEVLEKLGLSETEAKVYLTLIETGSTLAGPIIKKTGLHRGTTYQILQRLKEKGLVSSVVKGKKQYFQASDPEILMNILREKQEELSKIFPILKTKSESSKEKQEIIVYEGVKGIRAVMDKMLGELNPKGEYYDFGVSGLFGEIMKEYWDLWQKQKKRYKIKSHIIFNAELKKKNPKLIKDYYGEIKFHQKEYSSITDTIIYKDKVILLIWTAKPPIAVVIKNKDNAESYKNQFKFMWKYARK